MNLSPTKCHGSAANTSAASSLWDPAKREIAMQLVSAAENSSLCWKLQHQYIEYNVEKNPIENRGYTGGIVGFTSKTGDMLKVVELFESLAPGNRLTTFIDALRKVNKSSKTEGLGQPFEDAWRSAEWDPDPKKQFRANFWKAQSDVCEELYFKPAVDDAQRDGLRTLGQFIYFDALLMHGPGKAPNQFHGIRDAAIKEESTPTGGGNETEYLYAFLDARRDAMLMEKGHQETSRVDTMQRIFLFQGNLDLNVPLTFRANKETFTIPV
jgi:chitosanase